jgi:hypothetical protein
MSEIPARVRRAFDDHGSFERRAAGEYGHVATPFEGRVAVDAGPDGRVAFDVTVRVPLLSAVTADEVAPVVEEGWFETFERRVADAGGVTRGDHDVSPTVSRSGLEAVVSASFADPNERRGVDDANAVVNFVEGTYVQGIIPGYEYTEPVTSLVDRARTAGGAGRAGGVDGS